MLSADHPVSVTCIDHPEKLPNALWERLGEVVVPVTVHPDIPDSNSPTPRRRSAAHELPVFV